MTFNKLYTALASTALLLGAAACTDKVDYNPAPAYNGDEVYFSADEATEVDIPTDATQVTVNLYRVNADKELTVGLDATVTDAEGTVMTGVFDPTTQVTFPAGATVVAVPIGVTFADVTPEYTYNLHLAVVGEKQTPYGLTAQDFTLVYSPWSPFKPVLGTEPALCTLNALANFTENPIPVYESKSLVNENMVKYQFGNYDCPELEENENNWQSLCNGNNGTIVYDKSTGYCTFPIMWMNIEVSGEQLYYTDVYTYVTQVNPDAIPAGATADNFRGLSGYDEQGGTFYMNMIYYTSAGILAQESDVYQLPGFKSYYINMNYIGTLYYNKLQQEAVQLKINRSDGVASYAYRLEEGDLTTEQIKAVADEIKADTDAELIYDETTTLEFFLRVAGPYTVVAVGYDESGETVVSTYYKFDYEPVAPYNWKTVGNAEYTDGFLYSMYSGMEAATWFVEVEQSTEDPGIIRLVNPYRYTAGGWNMASPSYDLEGNYYVNIVIGDRDGVYVTSSQLGIMLSDRDGEISVSSLAYVQMTENKMTLNRAKRLGYCGKMDADDCITFPAGSLYIGYANNNNGEWIRTNLTPGFDVTASNPDYAGQLKETGEFFLDLSSCTLDGAASAPRKIVGRKAIKPLTLDEIKPIQKVNLIRK